MNQILRKLTSRKLWMAIVGVATGIYLALGGDADELQSALGTITAMVSAVTYIVVEGNVDAEGVKNEGVDKDEPENESCE